jgi:hypothetical protein
MPLDSTTPEPAATLAATAAASNRTPSKHVSRSSEHSHPPPSPSNGTNIVKKNRSDVIRTIQDITKFDEFTINQAIEACQDSDGRYSMDTVLNILMDEKSSSAGDSHHHHHSSSHKSESSKHYGSSPSSNEDNTNVNSKYFGNRKTADLSYGSENSKNLAYTYAMSGSGLDENDDDDYNAIVNNEITSLLASIHISGPPPSDKEDGPTTKTTRNPCEAHFMRETGKPCGLRNIGNTCWFNSIIQALFHLPVFRQVIFSFQLESSSSDTTSAAKLLNDGDTNTRNVTQFVLELRRLFALMLRSARRSINPSQTLKLLKKCSKFDADAFNQEDVSEFATILINLIEDSFNVLYKLQQQCQTQRSEIDKCMSPVSDNELQPSSGSVAVPESESTQEELTKDRKNRTNNPIANLFDGDIKIIRKSSDDASGSVNTLEEIFREVNIQMLNARNLYEG